MRCAKEKGPPFVALRDRVYFAIGMASAPLGLRGRAAESRPHYIANEPVPERSRGVVRLRSPTVVPERRSPSEAEG